MYDVLQPDHHQCHHRHPQEQGGAGDTRRDRIELAGLGFHWPNASLTHRLENTLGYNPLRLGLYSAAVGAEDHVGPARPAQVLSPLSLLPLDARQPAGPALHRHRRADRDHGPHPEGRAILPLVARTGDGYIYENPAAVRPRAVCHRAAKGADFPADARTTAYGRTRTCAPPSCWKPRPLADASRAPGRARIVSYRNTRGGPEADSPDGGWVVLNDLWHPWWFAEVDGHAGGNPARQRSVPARSPCPRAGTPYASCSVPSPAPGGRSPLARAHRGMPC